MDDNEALIIVIGMVMLFLLLRRVTAPLRRHRQGVGDEALRVCGGCDHHYSFHDPENFHCSKQRQIAAKWDSYGREVGYEYMDCECRVYDGPMPAISPQIMRELQHPAPSVEPFSQDK